MKKIVIFGATGNIGAYLVDYCYQHINKKQYEIVAVGRKQTDYFKIFQSLLENERLI